MDCQVTLVYVGKWDGGISFRMSEEGWSLLFLGNKGKNHRIQCLRPHCPWTYFWPECRLQLVFTSRLPQPPSPCAGSRGENKQGASKTPSALLSLWRGRAPQCYWPYLCAHMCGPLCLWARMHTCSVFLGSSLTLGSPFFFLILKIFCYPFISHQSHLLL